MRCLEKFNLRKILGLPFSEVWYVPMKREVSQRISLEKECDENGFVGTISFPRWEFNIQMLGKLGGHWRGNLLRSVPFLMAGHLNIKSFQTLGTPFFNTNPKNGCPKMICQHSGQAPKHLTCHFHYMSCSTDVRPWDSKHKFVFLQQIVPITKTLAPNASK